MSSNIKIFISIVGICIMLFSTNSLSIAEEIVTTKTGKNVLLKDDGTWEYYAGKTITDKSESDSLSENETAIEKKTGVRLISETSKWDWKGSFSQKLLMPHLTLKFKNVSQSSIQRLVVKATFLDIDKKEVFGEANSYMVGNGDSPLPTGFSKTAYLSAGVGYKNDMVALSFPNIVCEVYVNDILYKKIKISKMYNGMDWGKK